MAHYWDFGFQNYQIEKKSVSELGHSDLLSVYESSFAKKCQYCKKYSTDFSQIRSGCANEVLSNLCDWAVQDGRRLLFLKIANT